MPDNTLTALPPYQSQRGYSTLVVDNPIFRVIAVSPTVSDAMVEKFCDLELARVAVELEQLDNTAIAARARTEEFLPSVREEKVAEIVQPVVDKIAERCRVLNEEAAKRAERAHAISSSAIEEERRKPADVGDRVALEMQAREVRDILRGLTERERMGFLSGAPAQVLIAALDAPDGLVPDDQRARLKHEFALGKYPWLDTMQEEADFLVGAVRFITRGVESAVQAVINKRGIEPLFDADDAG